MNGWVQEEAARAILSAAGQDLDQLSAAAAKKGFKPVALGLKASTSFGSDIRKFASKNVIGVLKGSEAPGEYVLHTAHWDHLGHCNPAPMATTSATARSTMPPAPRPWWPWTRRRP